MLFLHLEHLHHRVGERKGAAAGFVLHLLHWLHFLFPVFPVLHDFGVQQHGALLPVNPRPPHAQGLAAAQAHGPRQENGRVDHVSSCQVQQGEQLLLGVILPVELVLFGTSHPVEGVGVDSLLLKGLLESPPQQGVVVDHRVGHYPVREEALVKVLDVLGF